MLLVSLSPVWQLPQATVLSLNSTRPRSTAAGSTGAARAARGWRSIQCSAAVCCSGTSLGPDIRPTNTLSISSGNVRMSPFQWKGSVPEIPADRLCVRRAPSQAKFQTRPSSAPSAWQDAQATNPPALL